VELVFYVTDAAGASYNYEIRELRAAQYNPIYVYSRDLIWQYIGEGEVLATRSAPTSTGWHHHRLSSSFLTNWYSSGSDGIHFALGLMDIGDNDDEFIFDGAGSSREPYIIVTYELPDTSNGITKGDIDNDGDVDLADAILVLQVIVGLNPAGLDLDGDVNNDGKIGVEESIYTLQFISGLRQSPLVDNDNDGYTENQGDCNDYDISVYPGATEICGDGVDQDCNGADISCPSTWYKDSDGDGYSDGITKTQVTRPTGYYLASELTAITGDCNDGNSTIYPGATEICGDGVDQDCDGSDRACGEPSLFKLTTSSRNEDRPSWSPDGSKVVYCEFDTISSTRKNEWIWTINSSGGTPTKVAMTYPNMLDEFCRSPFWGPSNQIVFEAAWGTSTIYKVNSSGGAVTRIAGPGDDGGNIRIASDPTWDHSGSDNIAFIGKSQTNVDNLYIIKSDGSGLRKITNFTGGEQINDVAFSPNGTKLLFSKEDSGGFNIWTIDISSGSQTQLTSNSGVNGTCSWSPDGTKIVFTSNRDGNFEIYIMSNTGGDVKRLTSNSAFDWYPEWSPDGSKIAFSSDRDGSDDIWVISNFY